MTGGESVQNHESENKTSTHESPEHKPAATAAAEDKRDKDGSDSEADGAEEILEESPCKRWSKRREKVKQRDVPGIDAAFLAMDNETGNEVVWNEVQFSERKNFREQEEKLRSVFNNLTQLIHVNLVKFHKYWTDSKSEKPRIIFITEYMSSGSMSRFLQRARSSGTLLNIKAWKKWATQILSALNYLHSCDPPIVHGNLTCNTIFIQQNGLIKIGCVAPNAIHHHVKTFHENIKNMHYVAPEFEYLTEATPPSDIYSFGICALEMATTGALQWGCCNGETTSVAAHQVVTLEAIRKAVESLEDPLQKDFIEKCLNPEPEKRPGAHELLFHSVLFEVHSLKLIASHTIVNSKLMDQLSEDDFRIQDKTKIVVSSKWRELSYAELSSFQIDLDKFLEDVRNGIYPLIAFAPLAHQPITNKLLNTSPSVSGISGGIELGHKRQPSNQQQQNTGGSSHDSKDGDVGLTMTADKNATSYRKGSGDGGNATPNVPMQNGPVPVSSSTTAANGGFNSSSAHLTLPHNEKDEGYHTAQSTSGNNNTTVTPTTGTTPSGESRLIVQMQATVVDNSSLNLLLQLDDQMNRQLTTDLSENDTAEGLVAELIQHGFISEADSTKMCSMLKNTLDEWHREREAEKESNREGVQNGPTYADTSSPPPPLASQSAGSSNSGGGGGEEGN